jgi:hypothetical protein
VLVAIQAVSLNSTGRNSKGREEKRTWLAARDASAGESKTHGQPGKQSNADEDGAGTRDEGGALDKVHLEHAAGKVGHQLRRVLQREGHLERESGEDQAGRHSEVEPDREPAEAVGQVVMHPEVRCGNETPEQHGVRLEEGLYDVWLAGELLARLVPASDHAHREEQGGG